DHLLVAKELAGPPIELPKNSGLSGVEYHFLIADIDQHALEHLIEVERLRRGELVIPRELAIVGIQRDRRARVEQLVGERRAAIEERPGFCLRGAPICEVELRIVAPRDPRLTAASLVHRQLAPRVRIGTFLRASLEPP